MHIRRGLTLAPTLALLVTTVMVMKSGVQATVQKCYGKLGCFDSRLLNALPQDPAYLHTEFRLSCDPKMDESVIDAVTDETRWKQIIDNAKCFKVDKLTAFIIHGFRDKAEAVWVKKIRDFLVEKKNYNVFTVDWHRGSGFLFEQAAANTQLVSKQLGMFINFLESDKGLDPLRIHLIGHSLGAHIAGNAGHHISPLQVARITGLDPAEPYFQQLDDTKRLDASDANFVDVIHTDGEKFTGLKGFGSRRSQGDVDFFPNGGEKQPGCQDLPPGTASFLRCSHKRAHQLFVQSLTSSACHLEALSCPSWDDFRRGQCMGCPPGGCIRLGLDTPPQSRGNYYLSTSSVEPFCGNSYHVELTTSPGQGHSYGHLGMDILDRNMTKSHGYLGGADVHFHGSETHHYVVTLPSDVQQLKSLTVSLHKGSGFSAIGTSSLVEFSKVNVTSMDTQQSWASCKLFQSDDYLNRVDLETGDTC